MSPCLIHSIPEQKFPTTSVSISSCLQFVSSPKYLLYSLQIQDFLTNDSISSLFLLYQFSPMAWPGFPCYVCIEVHWDTSHGDLVSHLVCSLSFYPISNNTGIQAEIQSTAVLKHGRHCASQHVTYITH